MAKLHELLAVEPDLKKVFQRVADEVHVLFTRKSEHFRGHHKSLKMQDEERAFEEAAAEETKTITTTVMAKLHYAAKSGAKYIDALATKEATNQTAKANLVVNGKVIAEDLPATFLLGLESKLKVVREYLAHAPTLDPAHSWVPAENLGEGIFQTEHDDVRERQEKKTAYITVAQATEHHPAQVAKELEAKIVGLFTTKRTSAMISPAEKSELMERCDLLIRATKQARQRANQAEVVKKTIGAKLFNFILTGEA